MQDLLNQITPVLTTTLMAILVAFISYIGKEVVKLAPKLVDFVIAKIGLTNYTKSKLVALDIWNVIEEHFRLNKLIGDTVQAKVTMFESLIKQKIPGITDAEIEILRQSIAGELNKGKVAIEKEFEEPTVTVEAPIIKYFNADGIELQPVIATASITNI